MLKVNVLLKATFLYNFAHLRHVKSKLSAYYAEQGSARKRRINKTQDKNCGKYLNDLQEPRGCSDYKCSELPSAASPARNKFGGFISKIKIEKNPVYKS